ncbi:MAG: DUF87 domain-containing protein [Clostridia bacterium]|nr:DUF87 domain-containing protein [Clostridia bacterium]
MEQIKILPSSLEIKYDYLKIEGLYISTITIIKYETNIEILKTIEALTGDDEIELSFHIKRENNFEILKKLTNIIAENSSELGSISKNQIDINVIDNMKKNATELRRKIQIDNEQIYMLSTYIVIKENTVEQLVNKQKRYINSLYARQLVAKPSNFRQKEAYLATLPIIQNSPVISKYTHSVFTEQALAKLFPFFEKDVLSKNGILLGRANNNLCAIDMFEYKNNNYNMCIFGSSGAGKSYFVKLMIIKNAYKGVRQIIIDPEGEYVDLVKNLGGHVYTIANYNPFEINEASLKDENFFSIKIEQIVDYVSNRINVENKEKLRECIVNTYNMFGINKGRESLYKLNNNDKLYIKPQFTDKFPTIEDLVLAMEQEGFTNLGKLRNTCCENIARNDTETYCFNLKGKSIKDITDEMQTYMPKIYELIKEETLIYFDEVWKTIGLGQDRYVIENIYNMFKTLRKNKAGIIIISQDICDLFSLDGGGFGKSILNNANTKVLFKMEWQDIEMFERMLQSAKISGNIKTLARGNAYVSMGNTNFNLEVKATEYEHRLIEGESYEENINSNG